MIKNSLPWPDNARCAAAFTFDMDAESLVHLNYPDTGDTHVATLSDLRYGPKIAIPRILELFSRYGMRQTFFVPGWCLETYPETINQILAGGHEIAHHGYLHEVPNKLSREDERYWFERAIDTIVRIAGRRPKGFRAPNYGFSKHSLELLIGHGFDYDASLMGDDIPYLLQHDAGTLIELPSHRALDDWTYFVLSRDLNWVLPVFSPDVVLKSYRAEFDAMWTHGGLWIAVWHPFVTGRLARCEMMVELIEHMQRKGGVWFATLEEIAAHVRGLIATGKWTPRTERMPYVISPISALQRR
jgi:peptidoglycan-N-acetylglucosamine deacetylase